MNECVGHCKVFLLFQVRVDCEIIVSHWITDFFSETVIILEKDLLKESMWWMIFYVALRSIIVVIIVQ